jgi:hypothetical protein
MGGFSGGKAAAGGALPATHEKLKVEANRGNHKSGATPGIALDS